MFLCRSAYAAVGANTIRSGNQFNRRVEIQRPRSDYVDDSIKVEDFFIPTEGDERALGHLYTFTGDGTVITKDSCMINGDCNVITGSHNIIWGDANTITGNNNKIRGDTNFITGNNNEMVGDANTI